MSSFPPSLLVALRHFLLCCQGFQISKTMVTACLFILLFFKLVSSQQPYDQTSCPSTDLLAGSRYSCSSAAKSCPTFMVYRSQQGFQTVAGIASLLGVDEDQVLQLNNFATPNQILHIGTDVVIPINCSCSGEFFQSNFSYTIPESTSYGQIACGVFENLVKSKVLLDANPFGEDDLKAGDVLNVPVKCACPDNFSLSYGFEHLLTYPLIEGDQTGELGEKFGIAVSDISAANNLTFGQTVFANTTLLVPLKGSPVINRSVSDSDAQQPEFVPTITIDNTGGTSNQNVYIAGGGIAVFFILGILAAGGYYVKISRRLKKQRLIDSSAIRSRRLSGDLHIRMSMLKYSLFVYSFEQLQLATRNFTEENRIVDSTHKGRIGDADVIIKRMIYSDCHRVIDIYSKISHTNIVNLLGVSYGESDSSCSYLVYELPGNGCLRDCLSNQLSVVEWQKRTQVAFDIAMGLHYLHHCTFPSYIHMSVNSRNIWVTEQWRAKLAIFGAASAGEAKGDMVRSIGGWTAPECLLEGMVSPKLDIYGFGVILLELLTGKGGIDRKYVKQVIGCLGGEKSGGGCFDNLRGLMDSRLKEDYPLGEALCLAILAKACVDDDPKHRPSMDGILRVLARVV